MPPYSKPYPLTKGLSHIYQSPKNGPLPLCESNSLAYYQKQQADRYLKDIVGHLKEPLELFPKIIVHLRLSVTIQSDHGIVQHQWELTIKEARRSLHCVLDALGVLHQGLFHSKVLLKLVNQIVEEEKSLESFGEEEVERLKKLKENLLKLNKFLDCVLLHYSSFSCGKPPIEEIKRAAKKIYKTINNLKPDRLKNLIPDSTVTEEDVLCSVLGLQDDFACRLRNLSEEMRNHKSDMYFLLCFVKERNASLNLENFSDKAEVERSLQKLGFTENRSKIIANWISEQPFPEHKSLLAWAEIYIENLFKYDIFLNDLVSEFPYEGKSLNKWFDVDVERDGDEYGKVSVSPVKVINTTTEKEAVAHIKKKVVDFEASNPKGQLYFHGTDHDGAKSILEDGINLNEGKTCCDFSHGKGFYLADDFNIALQYAQKSKASAVVLFNISEDSLKKGLDLSHSERRDDLKSVTSFFRKGEHRANRPEQKLYKEVNNCNYIIGPISRDGRPDDGKKWKNVQQMCVKKQGMADEIGNPLRIGIVFLNTKDRK